MPEVHVCPLSLVPDTVARARASHLVSLINDNTPVTRPHTIAATNHLFLGINDIVEPMEGMVLPAEDHVRELIDFVDGWDRRRADRRPLLRRHQPVDRGRLHRALRRQSVARRGRDRAAPPLAPPALPRPIP